MVADPSETFMFHILPDSTGSSAIWIAQRIPDNHISAVANQFVITRFNLDDTKVFLSSKNIFDEAKIAGYTGGKLCPVLLPVLANVGCRLWVVQ